MRVRKAAESVMNIGMGEVYVGVPASELAEIDREVRPKNPSTTHAPVYTFNSYFGEHTLIRHDDGSGHVHVGYPQGRREPYLLKLPGGGFLNLLRTFGDEEEDEDPE